MSLIFVVDSTHAKWGLIMEWFVNTWPHAWRITSFHVSSEGWMQDCQSQVLSSKIVNLHCRKQVMKMAECDSCHMRYHRHCMDIPSEVLMFSENVRLVPVIASSVSLCTAGSTLKACYIWCVCLIKLLLGVFLTRAVCMYVCAGGVARVWQQWLSSLLSIAWKSPPQRYHFCNGRSIRAQRMRYFHEVMWQLQIRYSHLPNIGRLCGY